jgi:ribosomal-protein-alanine N-acetyltransferase
MVEADLTRVTALERELFSDPWSEIAFREGLNEPGWECLVAQVDNEIVAYACVVIIDVEAHLTNIAVAQAFQRKSVAKQLLKHILRVVKEAQCQYLLLEVRPSNTGAVDFYRKHGFHQMYRRPGYYRNPPEDALVMVYYLDEI